MYKVELTEGLLDTITTFHLKICRTDKVMLMFVTLNVD